MKELNNETIISKLAKQSADDDTYQEVGMKKEVLDKLKLAIYSETKDLFAFFSNAHYNKNKKELNDTLEILLLRLNDVIQIEREKKFSIRYLNEEQLKRFKEYLLGITNPITFKRFLNELKDSKIQMHYSNVIIKLKSRIKEIDDYEEDKQNS